MDSFKLPEAIKRPNNSKGPLQLLKNYPDFDDVLDEKPRKKVKISKSQKKELKEVKAIIRNVSQPKLTGNHKIAIDHMKQ